MHDPHDGNYAASVQQLLNVGVIGDYNPATWPDYTVAFGIGPGHSSDLIRLACDLALHTGDPDSAGVWALLHAWRALGQLRAEDAVPKLLALLTTFEHDEAVEAELPVVFAMIGPAAIPHLGAFLSDRSNASFAATTAISAIMDVALRHPAHRDACLAILTRVLEPDAKSDPMINGCIVSALLDLRAVETIDAMRAAFRRNAIDRSIAGDLEDVEIELGLRAHRATPAPR